MKKIISICITLLLFLNCSSAAIASSFENDRFIDFEILSVEYISSDRDNGLFMIEKILIEGNEYLFKHYETFSSRKIVMSGYESGVFEADKSSTVLTITDEEGNSIEVRTSDWTYTSPVENSKTFAIANLTKAALATGLATMVGGPVGAFIAMAGVIFGFVAGVQFTCRTVTRGKWKPEGTHIRYSYTTNVYVLDRVYSTTWGGTR
ncbi:MAG: hypothetical protein Q4G61_10000 [Tissierellia bacterium]|nr:hypothetical protein [Tissierellia bacterium]